MIQSVLVKKAINAATNSEWQNAIEINEKILESYPHDLDSLNRLARACFEIGDFSRSKKIYKEVLTHDPYNVIALKNLKRFQAFRGNTDDIVITITKTSSNSGLFKHITSFIEEPGKTKVVQLVRVAEPHVLFTLHCGDQVQLEIKSRGVHVFSAHNVYIGRLPDDLGHQLHYFIKNGNKYEAFVKQIQPNVVLLFIRETFRSPEFASRPTFSSSGAHIIPEASGEVNTTSDSDEDSVPEEQETN